MCQTTSRRRRQLPEQLWRQCGRQDILPEFVSRYTRRKTPIVPLLDLLCPKQSLVLRYLYLFYRHNILRLQYKAEEPTDTEFCSPCIHVLIWNRNLGHGTTWLDRSLTGSLEKHWEDAIEVLDTAGEEDRQDLDDHCINLSEAMPQQCLDVKIRWRMIQNSAIGEHAFDPKFE